MIKPVRDYGCRNLRDIMASYAYYIDKAKTIAIVKLTIITYPIIRDFQLKKLSHHQGAMPCAPTG